jgi:hypothetical protein
LAICRFTNKIQLSSLNCRCPPRRPSTQDARHEGLPTPQDAPTNTGTVRRYSRYVLGTLASRYVLGSQGTSRHPRACVGIQTGGPGGLYGRGRPGDRRSQREVEGPGRMDAVTLGETLGTFTTWSPLRTAATMLASLSGHGVSRARRRAAGEQSPRR